MTSPGDHHERDRAVCTRAHGSQIEHRVIDAVLDAHDDFHAASRVGRPHFGNERGAAPFGIACKTGACRLWGLRESVLHGARQRVLLHLAQPANISRRTEETMTFVVFPVRIRIVPSAGLDLGSTVRRKPSSRRDPALLAKFRERDARFARHRIESHVRSPSRCDRRQSAAGFTHSEC